MDANAPDNKSEGGEAVVVIVGATVIIDSALVPTGVVVLDATEVGAVGGVTLPSVVARPTQSKLDGMHADGAPSELELGVTNVGRRRKSADGSSSEVRDKRVGNLLCANACGKASSQTTYWMLLCPTLLFTPCSCLILGYECKEGRRPYRDGQSLNDPDEFCSQECMREYNLNGHRPARSYTGLCCCFGCASENEGEPIPCLPLHDVLGKAALSPGAMERV